MAKNKFLQLKNLITQKHNVTRIVAAMCFLAVLLNAFQNCAGPMRAATITPVNSPFFSQKIYLSAKEVQASEKDSDGKIPVTLIVNNRCALNLCNQEGMQNSVICGLTRNNIKKELSDAVQAFDWAVPADSTESSIDQLLAANQADYDCTVGVALRRTYQTKLDSPPNDPQKDSQYHHAVLQTEEAMTFFAGSLSSVNVGLIDTGVDLTHEDLKQSGLEWGPQSSVTTASCPSICNFHGSFMAGIINATKNNGKGGYGIAPNAYIHSARIGNADGQFTSTELYNALNWLTVINQVEIVNMSIGGSEVLDQTIQDAIVRMIDKDILLVIAAGNNGQDLQGHPIYPASFNYDGQINVASASPSTIDPSKAGTPDISGPVVLDSYSNFNSGIVHIAAPGRGIFSTTLNNSYAVASGTSCSTPMVTASLAILKGYLKYKGYTNPSAGLLKQLLLEGSNTLPSLQDKVNGGKYLNLLALKAKTEAFISTIGSGPTQVSLISSETTTDGTKKLVHVKVEVNGAEAGQVLKVYTNKAFLDETYTGLSCSITQARQFCEFDVNFNALYVDPGLYFKLSSADGTKLIADLTVPKENLNFGVRSEADLIGEISSVRAVPGYYHAEGWACLVGFTDAIDIEVHANTPTGPIVRYLKTIRQARGDFFQRCQAAGIDFGFTFVVPTNYLNTSTRFYFKARHQGTGKTLDIPVLSYQPGYNDSKPAQYTDSIYVDALAIGEKPTLKITKREFNNWQVNIEGSICYPNSKRPAVARLDVGLSKDGSYLIPELWDAEHNTNTASTQETAKFTTEMHGWNFPNSRYVTPPAHLGIAKCDGSPFSDITYPCVYNDPRQPEKSINFLAPLPYIASPVLPPPGQTPTTNNNLSYDIIRAGAESTGTSVGGLIDVTTNIEIGDGCAQPSGFKVSVDIRKFIAAINFSTILTYRSDMIDRDTAIARTGWPARIFQPQPDRTFEQLRFGSRAFSLALNTVNGVVQLFENDTTAFYNALAAQAKTSSTGAWKFYSETKPGFWREFWTWKDFPAVVLGTNLGAELSQVYDSGDQILKVPNSSRMMIKLDLVEGTKYGTLGTDFRVEFAVNGSTQWTEAPVDVVYSGSLGADVDLPENTNSVRFRIVANNKNAFKISNIGFMTQ